jgi:hypothetical protein
MRSTLPEDVSGSRKPLANEAGGRADWYRVIHDLVEQRPQWTTVMGSGLVLAGLALFMVVFFTLLPILTDPVTAYDKWFPVEEAGADPAVPAPAQEGPLAMFSWEAVAVATLDPPVYRVRLKSTSVEGAAGIEEWQWDLGDGTGERGKTVVHDYAEYGAYRVTLTVLDQDGRADSVGGEIAVPGVASTAGGVGQVDEFSGFDIDASIQDAVESVGDEIKSTTGTAVDSIGASARGGVVVFLFALAALATTVVAWRVARIGVMILNGPRQRLPLPPAPPRYDNAESRGELEMV